MRRILAAMVAIVTAAGVLLCFSCARTSIERYYQHISDYRDVVLRYEGADFTLDAFSGVREAVYELDAHSADKKTEYTVFVYTPMGGVYIFEEFLPLNVSVGGTVHDLKLSPHPFQNSYSTEIAVRLSGDDASALTLSIRGEEATLLPPFEDAVDGEFAFTLALETLGEFERDMGSFEIYIRLCENPLTAVGGWYWFVSIMGNKTRSVLISLVGEVCAVRN